MLIGFAGFAGSGKSTAIDYLVRKNLATSYYAGSILVEELAKRELTHTPDTERSVREALRSEYGMAVFAERSLPHLIKRCARETVLLDAIYCPEECECYLAAFGDRLKVIAVSTLFETRAARLASRPQRPLSTQMLIERDRLERERFRMDEVINRANHKISNDNSLTQFERSLDGLPGFLA